MTRVFVINERTCMKCGHTLAGCACGLSAEEYRRKFFPEDVPDDQPMPTYGLNECLAAERRVVNQQETAEERDRQQYVNAALQWLHGNVEEDDASADANYQNFLRHLPPDDDGEPELPTFNLSTLLANERQQR